MLFIYFYQWLNVVGKKNPNKTKHTHTHRWMWQCQIGKDAFALKTCSRLLHYYVGYRADFFLNNLFLLCPIIQQLTVTVTFSNSSKTNGWTLLDDVPLFESLELDWDHHYYYYYYYWSSLQLNKLQGDNLPMTRPTALTKLFG